MVFQKKKYQSEVNPKMAKKKRWLLALVAPKPGASINFKPVSGMFTLGKVVGLINLNLNYGKIGPMLLVQDIRHILNKDADPATLPPPFEVPACLVNKLVVES